MVGQWPHLWLGTEGLFIWKCKVFKNLFKTTYMCHSFCGFTCKPTFLPQQKILQTWNLSKKNWCHRRFKAPKAKNITQKRHNLQHLIRSDCIDCASGCNKLVKSNILAGPHMWYPSTLSPPPPASTTASRHEWGSVDLVGWELEARDFHFSDALFGWWPIWKMLQNLKWLFFWGYFSPKWITFIIHFLSFWFW